MGIVLVIGVIGGELLFQYEEYRIHGYWPFFELRRDIPSVLGLIFVVVLSFYLVKKRAKRE
jgi:hypothetical protein